MMEAHPRFYRLISLLSSSETESNLCWEAQPFPVIENETTNGFHV